MAKTTPPAILAAQSAGRAAGYCWMKHSSGAHCTRPPHGDDQHESFYIGRTSLTATTGIKWQA